MLTERRAYLLRLIQQVGVAARRLREQLSGEGADCDLIVREADQEIAALLGGGAQGQLLERLDAETAVRLIGDRERVRLWIDLLQTQAEALARRGSEQQSIRVRERAAALGAAAERLAESLGS